MMILIFVEKMNLFLSFLTRYNMILTNCLNVSLCAYFIIIHPLSTLSLTYSNSLVSVTYFKSLVSLLLLSLLFVLD